MALRMTTRKPGQAGEDLAPALKWRDRQLIRSTPPGPPRSVPWDRAALSPLVQGDLDQLLQAGRSGAGRRNIAGAPRGTWVSSNRTALA